MGKQKNNEKHETNAEIYREMICKLVDKIGNETILRKIYAIVHTIFLHEVDA